MVLQNEPVPFLAMFKGEGLCKHSPVKGLLLENPLARTPNSRQHTCNMQTLHSGPGIFPKPWSTPQDNLSRASNVSQSQVNIFNRNYQSMTIMESYPEPNYSTGKLILSFTEVTWQWLFNKNCHLKGAMQFD